MLIIKNTQRNSLLESSPHCCGNENSQLNFAREYEKFNIHSVKSI